jgi:hypothetical protein
LIRFDDGEHASVETYSQNFHVVRNPKGGDYDFVHGGRYLDKMEKRGSEWRISDRIIMIEWVVQSSSPSIDFQNGLDFKDDAVEHHEAAISARGHEDHLYTFLGDIAKSGMLNIPAFRP